MVKQLIVRSLLVTLIFAGKAIGQNKYVDSLEQVLVRSSAVEQQIELRKELARELLRISPEAAFRHITKLKQIADSIHSEKTRAHYYWLMSSYSSIQSNYLYSTSFAFQAIEEYQQLNDSVGMANSYVALSNNYMRQKLYTQGVQYLKKALPIFRLKKLERREAICLTNLAFLYNNLGYYDSALMVSERSMMLNKQGKYLSVLINDYKNVGYSNLLKGDYQTADKFFEEALTLNTQLGYNANTEAIGETLIGLGKLNLMLGKKRDGVDYLNRAVALAESFGYVAWGREALLELARYYNAAGDYKTSQKYLFQHLALTDSLARKQQLERARLGDVYMSALLESHQNKLLIKEKGLQEELIKQQQLGIFLGGASIILLGLLVYYLKQSNIRRRQVNEMLNEQKEEIASQKKELEKLNQTKDKFFSIVAHDLRSPLSSLKSLTALVGGHAEQLTKEEIVKMVKELEVAVDNTLKMTEGLITWARQQMQVTEWLPENIEVEKIVNEVSDVYKTAAEQKEITMNVAVENNPRAYVDKNQLIFIVRNLLNNAIKFTHRGGAIKIMAQQASPDKVLITVTDTGTGMDDATLQSLFKVGAYIKNKGTAGEVGTGLGLILCREFVLKNKGSIRVESKPKQGTTFYVELPTA
jgi:signal transduction histidine kinase